LQYAPTFLADDPSLEPLARALAGRLSATDEERVAALGRVRKALAHAAFDALRTALEVRREQTVVLPADRHSYGTVDVAYRDADGWVVVDYKSDADPIDDTRLAAYREQLALYTAAFSVPGGGLVRAVILLV
jgi:ATP-dependent exoDNAse (exonuclease V) beta subunit